MNKANEHSEKLLEQYLNTSVSDWEKIKFFILSGPSGVGKSETVVEMSKKILWDYFYNDFLHIKDFSKKLWKEHELKVEYNSDNATSKELLDTYKYTDLWTREINQRLWLSPAWTKRILLIENIERMNRAAMNAFLKTCEEPLANRIILATTSNKSRLLDTIISRAIIIPFFEYSYEELENYCDEKWYFSWDKGLKSFVCMMSMWKIWNVDLFHEKISENEELKDQFKNIISILEKENLWVKYQSLLSISNNWFIEPVLDWLISYYIFHEQFDKAQNWLNIRKNTWTNVKIDHLLFSGLI